jgi:hypothetical protein
MRSNFFSIPIVFILLLSVLNVVAQNNLTIYPKEVWPDDQGNHIQAHGGGIIKIKNTYYWYGEERRQGLDTNFRYVSCYASADLVNWKFKGDALKLSEPDSAGKNWVLERPKVYYNKKTKKYVMYFHLDGPGHGESGHGYKLAKVATAVSNKPEGPFQYVRSFRPLDKESRDIGQFIDDDGSAYLVFECRPTKGFYIAQLSEDYLDVAREIAFIQAPLEGGAIVHYEGLYYAIGSALTGWNPNPNKFATAKSLSGPWSEFKDIAPPETKTYGAQSTMMIKVVGTKSTTVIFMGDIWKPKTQWDSRYLWMPLEIGNGNLALPQPQRWILNVKTGESKIINPH